MIDTRTNNAKIKKKRSYRVKKRIFDILLGIIGLIPLTIALIFLVIPYKTGKNKGPMFFKQERIGRNGELFQIYKFRSMKVNADSILKSDEALYEKYVESGYKLEPEEDPRITNLGRFIRKTSIDELPQFINVIKGEMSLIGPRPIVEEELQEYRKENLENAFLSMKPGITGVWQTSGRSEVGYPDRVFLETSYCDQESITFDTKTVLMTAVQVFKQEGAY
ncbi:MAG: sugar transferase [Enterococcus sp.]